MTNLHLLPYEITWSISKFLDLKSALSLINVSRSIRKSIIAEGVYCRAFLKTRVKSSLAIATINKKDHLFLGQLHDKLSALPIDAIGITKFDQHSLQRLLEDRNISWKLLYFESLLEIQNQHWQTEKRVRPLKRILRATLLGLSRHYSICSMMSLTTSVYGRVQSDELNTLNCDNIYGPLTDLCVIEDPVTALHVSVRRHAYMRALVVQTGKEWFTYRKIIDIVRSQAKSRAMRNDIYSDFKLLSQQDACVIDTIKQTTLKATSASDVWSLKELNNQTINAPGKGTDWDFVLNILKLRKQHEHLRDSLFWFVFRDLAVAKIPRSEIEQKYGEASWTKFAVFLSDEVPTYQARRTNIIPTKFSPLWNEGLELSSHGGGQNDDETILYREEEERRKLLTSLSKIRMMKKYVETKQ